MPPEDPVQPAATQPRSGQDSAIPPADSGAEQLMTGPPDELPAPELPDPMSRAEAASATQPVAPPSPAAAASPDTPTTDR